MSASLRDQLLQVRAEAGALTPALVVDAARAKAHPLHSRFEWNDKIAGEAHRREQAHQLIRSVRVSYIAGDGAPKTTRAYVAVPVEDSPQPDYQPVEDLALDPVKKAIVLAQMEREWRTLRQRYGHLAEFLALVSSTAEDVAA